MKVSSAHFFESRETCLRMIPTLRLIVIVVSLVIPSVVHSATITIPLNQGFSFQNEGTLQFDDTARLSTVDGSWGPTTTGTVTQNAYATGSSGGWFDAISANFDLTGIDIGSIESADLRFYTRNGTSGGWPGNYHYQVLPGAFNPTNQDSAPTGTPFNLPTGAWITEPLPVSGFTSSSFDVTIRLWEAQVDAIELQLTVVAPEPSSLLLLGVGVFGLARFARQRKR